jgi:hypothetical protein
MKSGPFMFLAFCGLVPCCLMVGQKAEPSQEVPARNVDVYARSLTAALEQVALDYRVVIGFEETLSRVDHMSIVIRADSVSLSEVIENVLDADDRYTWREDPDGTILVFARGPQFTLPEVVMKSFRVENLNRFDIVMLTDRSAEVQQWLKENRCQEMHVLTTPPVSTYDDHVTLAAADRTLRENLNEVVKEMKTYYWHIGRFTAFKKCGVSVWLPKDDPLPLALRHLH